MGGYFLNVRIGEAIYRRKGIVELLKPFDINRKSYNEKYKNFLFCPYPNCTSRVSFIDSTLKIKYFRTWKKDVHIEGCPYSIKYEDLIKIRRKKNPDYNYRLSDAHIDSVLQRAYDLSNSKKNSKNNSTKHKSPKKTYTDEFIEPIGDATLGEGTETITNGREPSIYTRNLDNLNDEDVDKVRCVIGEVKFMWIDKEFSYINLNSQGNQVKVHFNEAFIASNSSEYSLFHYLKRFINENKNSICCVVGEVSKDKSGYNIKPDRFNGFSLNNKKLYSIVNDYILKDNI